MNKFKAGDKVVATVSSLHLIPEHKYKKGDVFTVSYCGRNAVWFEERGNFSYCAERFKLHTPEDTSSYHPHHDVIVAWAKGATIECDTGFGWNACPTAPRFYPEWKYRIAPEKTEKELEIERIESEMRKLADDLNKLKGV